MHTHFFNGWTNNEEFEFPKELEAYDLFEELKINVKHFRRRNL